VIFNIADRIDGFLFAGRFAGNLQILLLRGAMPTDNNEYVEKYTFQFQTFF